MNAKTEPKPQAAMNLDAQVRELAAGLRDAIRETPDSYLKENPEDAYVDLACRVLFRLAGKLTILPTDQITVLRARYSRSDAALRILDIFTRWLREHPECTYSTTIGASGKVELTFKTRDEVRAFFRGESVQDAYAQAAQTIDFNGGTL